MVLRLADLPAAIQARVKAAAPTSVPDPKVTGVRIPTVEHTEGLCTQLRALKRPAPVREFRFSETKQYRADLAWPAHRLLVEVDGGSWLPGKKSHTSGKGFERDRRKDALALALGYRTLRVTPKMITDGTAAAYICHLLGDPLDGFEIA